MTTKRFLALSFAALFLFVAFTAGGCGSSNSNKFAAEPDTTTEMPGILSVFDSPEFEIVGKELEAELVSEDLPEPQIHFVVILSGDDYFITDDTDKVSSANTQTVKSAATLPEDKLKELSAKLRPCYESGDVIALFLPSAATINDLYEAVGEPPIQVEYSQLLETSEDTYPEIYAIAKRYIGGTAHTFSYLVPGSTAVLGDILEELIANTSNDVSEDISINDPEDIDSKYAGLRPEYIFQARRYADFILWAARIDSKMEELAAFEASSEFPLRSASLSNEAKSGELFNYGAQMITLNLSYCHSSYTYVHFSAAANYTIYSFHNFSDKNDYYYVQANCWVKPEAYYKNPNFKGGVKTSGSMCWYEFQHFINGADYTLFSNAPKNVNRSRTISDGTDYSTNSTTGYKIGTEIGAEIGTDGGKISSKVTSEYSSSTSKTTGYNHSATWTANDWDLYNACDNTMPSWWVDFKLPGEENYFSDLNGNVPESSTRRNDLDSEWMWQVTNSQKSISIRGRAAVKMRQTFCNSEGYKKIWYFTGVKSAAAAIAKPPHIIASQKSFSFRSSGDVGQFKLLCSGKWQAVSDSEWCQVSPSSGEATGGDERDIFIYTTAFEQPGDLDSRIGHIMVKDTETGQIQTLTITQINK